MRERTAFFAMIFGMFLTAGFAIAQTPGSGPNVFGAGTYGPAYSNSKGHWVYGAGAPPALSDCGSSPSDVAGTDVAFQFTAGSSTSGACTITPAIAYGKRPTCVVDTASATKPSKTVSDAGVIILGSVQDAARYSVICYAQPGGF